ncbi:hypothetical protein [Microbacterium sp. LWH12-1.2]|uniref:hypothetical protein n=1 Tax=Microbacterium sp. LWH12-1.2 TaxID=3135259 RepID=UPI00343272F2
MSKTTARRTRLMSVFALAVALATAGCSTPHGDALLAEIDPAASSAVAASTEILLTTGHPVTVIGRGERVELCLGGVLDMLPPGCMGGVEMVGWDWDAVAGQYEESGEVRWGDFIVTGTYDSDVETFASTTLISGSGYGLEIDPIGPIFETRCEPPEGGWRILDETKATYETLHATTAAAATLDGYATTWLDHSLVPPVPEGTEVLDEMQHYALTAGHNILNVAVRGDAEPAEAILRQTWGGALCVFTVDYTEAELNAVLQELVATYSFLTAGPDGRSGTVWLSVVYDAGGELQREVDEKYGAGLVRVSSVLQPVVP